MALPYATEDQLKILERKTKAELDKKTANINLTANTLDDMNALIASGSVNDGQLCYLKEDKKLYVLKDDVWSEVGGGGKSVPPTLNLLDWSSEEPAVRTSITEEEKQNIEKGLYNSVNYFTEIPYETYLQSKLFSIYDNESKSLVCLFSSIKITAASETDISSTNIVYELKIGQKDTSGNYPITIEKALEIPFGSSSGGEGGGGSDVSSSPLELDGGRIQYISNYRYFPPINLTNEQVETIRTKYANKEPFLIKLKYEDNSTSGYFIELNAQNLSAQVTSYNNELGSLYTLIAFDSPELLSFLVEIDLYSKSISVTEKNFLYLDSTRVDINLNVKNALQLQYVRGGAWTPVSDYAIYFDTINGKPIIHSDSAVNSYNIPTITFED